MSGGYTRGKWIWPADFKVNTASGDGSTTVFALTHTPIAENQMQVEVNGLIAHPDDFSLSGKNVTFTAAPETDSKVVFRYIKEEL